MIWWIWDCNLIFEECPLKCKIYQICIFNYQAFRFAIRLSSASIEKIIKKKYVIVHHQEYIKYFQFWNNYSIKRQKCSTRKMLYRRYSKFLVFGIFRWVNLNEYYSRKIKWRIIFLIIGEVSSNNDG